MNVAESDIELIQRYLSGETTLVESKSVDDRLSSDPSFNELFLLQKDLQIVLKKHSNKKIKDYLNEFENPQHKKPNKLMWLIVSLGLAALFITAYFLIQKTNNSHPTPDHFANYYQAPSNDYVKITRGDANQNDTVSAFLAYQDGDYESALNKLSNIEVDRPGIQLYKAICLVEMNQFTEARIVLEQIKGPNEYAAQISWYRALIDIKLNKLESALKFLEELDETGVDFKKSSRQKLIKELKG